MIANDSARPGYGIGRLIDAGAVKKLMVSHIGTNPETQRQMIAGELEEMRALNQRYRGADRTTDVLSFEGGNQPDGRVSQGEIVISVDKARRQAAQRHHALEIEIRYLLIHGFLHLMGFEIFFIEYEW